MLNDNNSKPYNWTRDHLEDIVCHGKHKILDGIAAEAFKSIDRADFVPEHSKNIAYNDIEIHIGYGQNLSRPTIIAKQIFLLEANEGNKVLHIGAGSGYIASILGKIVKSKGKVITLERVLGLIENIRLNITKYPDLSNVVEILFKDGSLGYSSQAPYDRILSSVAFENTPPQMLEQLSIGGRLVIPTSDNVIKVIERENEFKWNEFIYEGFLFDQVQGGVE